MSKYWASCCWKSQLAAHGLLEIIASGKRRCSIIAIFNVLNNWHAFEQEHGRSWRRKLMCDERTGRTWDIGKGSLASARDSRPPLLCAAPPYIWIWKTEIVCCDSDKMSDSTHSPLIHELSQFLALQLCSTLRIYPLCFAWASLLCFGSVRNQTCGAIMPVRIDGYLDLLINIRTAAWGVAAGGWEWEEGEVDAAVC